MERWSCDRPATFYVTWRAMTWHDVTWHDMTWRDTTWRRMTWHMTWQDVTIMMWHDVKLRGMTWHDMTWRKITWHDVTLRNMPRLTWITWYDLTWCDVTQTWSLCRNISNGFFKSKNMDSQEISKIYKTHSPVPPITSWTGSLNGFSRLPKHGSCVEISAMDSLTSKTRVV